MILQNLIDLKLKVLLEKWTVLVKDNAKHVK